MSILAIRNDLEAIIAIAEMKHMNAQTKNPPPLTASTTDGEWGLNYWLSMQPYCLIRESKLGLLVARNYSISCVITFAPDVLDMDKLLI